jgi:hypothetical protein
LTYRLSNTVTDGTPRENDLGFSRTAGCQRQERMMNEFRRHESEKVVGFDQWEVYECNLK